MKQNWEKEGEKIVNHWIGNREDNDDCEMLEEFIDERIKKLINQAKQEERERILKALPKEKVGEPSWDGKSGTFGAFNEAIKQIKDLICKK